MKRFALLVVLAATFAGGARPANGHVFAPSLLELRQTAPDTYAVRWKQPQVLPTGAQAGPVLPVGCRAVSERSLQREDTGVAVLWTVHCPGGVEGADLAIEGLASTQASALVRIELADGRSIRHVLTADESTFRVPAQESLVGVGRSYGWLGIHHIAGGLDHLLFVLGLVLLVEGKRRLLVTVTAFTAGHSLTLALAVLGVVHVPQAPVEILIALSIYLLALELARRHAADSSGAAPEPSWMQRYPGWMAGGFGLFHGLGFAGALSEAGLPARDVPAALLAFNVGIELGQLAFVAVVLAIAAVLVRLRPVWPSAWARVPVYVIGCLSAYWIIERVAGMVS